MTRARDVANVLSTATSLATDTETAAAISSHNTAGSAGGAAGPSGNGGSGIVIVRYTKSQVGG